MPFRCGRFRFRVGVDGQVAVGAEVPGEEVPGAAGQRVRGQGLQRERLLAPLVDGWQQRHGCGGGSEDRAGVADVR